MFVKIAIILSFLFLSCNINENLYSYLNRQCFNKCQGYRSIGHKLRFSDVHDFSIAECTCYYFDKKDRKHIVMLPYRK